MPLHNKIVLAIISARGRSKRLPGKNIKSFAGKPLIAHTIEAARAAHLFDKIVVSTENANIARVSKKYKADIPFMRPRKLAAGHISRWDVVKFTAQKLKDEYHYSPDVIMDLSPTAPLRTASDIREALKKFETENLDAVLSVYKPKINPYFNMLEYQDKQLRLVKTRKQKITEGQNAPLVYAMNDAIHIMSAAKLQNSRTPLDAEKVGVYVMPRERSIDIDDEFDFMIAEYLYNYNAPYGKTKPF